MTAPTRRRRRRRGKGGGQNSAAPVAGPSPTPAQTRTGPTPATADRPTGRGARALAVGSTPRAPKKPPGEPRIGVGSIVLRDDEILLVRERGRWSLPKGGLDVGELVIDGARRETYEETGLEVEMSELAFVVEFQAQTWGHHVQFFFLGREVGGTLGPRDPDKEVQEARFVPLREIREYLRFRPRLIALETWLRERRPRHFVFNLDKEPAMLRKRRRVEGPGGAVEPK